MVWLVVTEYGMTCIALYRCPCIHYIRPDAKDINDLLYGTVVYDRII